MIYHVISWTAITIFAILTVLALVASFAYDPAMLIVAIVIGAGLFLLAAMYWIWKDECHESL